MCVLRTYPAFRRRAARVARSSWPRLHLSPPARLRGPRLEPLISGDSDRLFIRTLDTCCCVHWTGPQVGHKWVSLAGRVMLIAILSVRQTLDCECGPPGSQSRGFAVGLRCSPLHSTSLHSNPNHSLKSHLSHLFAV